MSVGDQTIAQAIQESFDHTWVAEVTDSGDRLGDVNGLGQLGELLTDHAAGHPPFDVALKVNGSPRSHDFTAEWDETGRAVRIVFRDGSALELPSTISSTLDAGAALLEPITVREYASIESVLDQLWKAIDDGQLDDHHRLQLRAMYDVLFEDHRDSVPGDTPRHRLVGTVRSLALMSNQEGIRAALAWWKIAEVCQGIDWHTVARMFPGGPK